MCVQGLGTGHVGGKLGLQALQQLLPAREDFMAADPPTKPTLCPPPAAYYAYWERRVFAAVNSMVLGALDAVQKRLEACAAGGRAPVLTVGGSGLLFGGH